MMWSRTSAFTPVRLKPAPGGGAFSTAKGCRVELGSIVVVPLDVAGLEERFEAALLESVEPAVDRLLGPVGFILDLGW